MILCCNSWGSVGVWGNGSIVLGISEGGQGESWRSSSGLILNQTGISAS